MAACSGRNLTRAEEDNLEVSSDNKYALRYWHKIVEAYSGCKLTRAEDKLVAISGLAKRVQSFLGDEYLAGLWKKALLYGPLWRARWEDLKEEHASSQAPTWSWASVEGFIFYDDLMIPWDDEEHLSIKIVTILASGVISVAADVTGQIKVGFIRLSSTLIAARIREKQSSLSPNFDCILDLPVFRHGGYWYPFFHFETIERRAGIFVLEIWIVIIDGE